MILAIAIFAVLSFQQTNKPETVALVFGPDPVRIEFTKTEDAERLYRAIELKRQAGTANEEDERLHAALTAALGTLRQDIRTLPQTDFERSRHEQLRWQRPATQKPEPKERN